MRSILFILILLLSFTNCSESKKRSQLFFSFGSVLYDDENSSSGPNSGSTSSNVGGKQLVGISIYPPYASIPVNAEVSYTATAIYSDSTKSTKNVTGSVVSSDSSPLDTQSTKLEITNSATWNLGSNDIASSLGSGRVKGLSVGSSTISANFQNLTGSAYLEVTNKTITSIQIISIPSLVNGTSTQFTAVAVFSDGTTLDITNLGDWSTSDANKASVGNGSENKGLVNGVATGSVSISVSYGGVSASRPISIVAANLVSISIGGNATVGIGTNKDYVAIGTFSNGATQDITQSVTWSSSNTAVASVNDNTGINKGQATALTAGSTTITATLGSISGSATLTVSPATLVSLTINTGGNNTLVQGTTKPLTVIGTYSDGTTADLTNSVAWTSSNNNTASVSNAAGTEGLVYGLNSGTVSITASIAGISTSVNLNVEALTLSSITITGPSSLEVSATGSYTAIGTYNNGVTQNITHSVVWNSSNPNKALISNADLDRGVAYGQSTGNTSITASLGGVTSNTIALNVTNTTTSGSTTQTVAGYDINLPSGVSTTTPPSGDFNGITYQGDPAEVAGFVSAVNYTGTAGCTNFGAALLTAMAADTPDLINNWSQISAPVIGTNPNCSIVYDLAMTTKSNTTVTGLSNHLISVIGTSMPGGTVTGFPASGATEQNDTSFRVLIQATYSTTGAELVAVGVSRAENYAVNQTTLTSLINGTSIVPAGSTILAKTDTFTGAEDPKVDFVWVVDNSGSMKEEQTSVSNNAVTFFNLLNNKRLDFRLAVIATGSTGSNLNTLNPGGSKAWELWGSSQDGSRWVYKTDNNAANRFKQNVDSVGLNGSGRESGIFFAERALGGAPSGITPVSPTIVPRPGAKLIFVILSDEGDHYRCYSGGSFTSDSNVPNHCTGGVGFNVENNIFTQNNYKVYAIIGLHDGSLSNPGNLGEPGRCDSNPSNSSAPKANNVNNRDLTYYNLANATGGSSASICNTDYTTILDNIATQAAANSSSYVLTKIPIASTIVVKVNGSIVTQDATNGWQYNSSSNTIVFSGTAWPDPGANIEVSYSYLEGSTSMASGDQTLTAYLVRTVRKHTTAIGLAVAALAALALAGRYMFSRRGA